ncbi:hypothetical protein QJS10_CPB15g00517 [Acorus calamus]|uniref:Uncharacterized protein n=1 Tax=Acorus calamus TaxID=4465 RepID=A0AAV9DAP2_ACOCL|nr:hypothetical protein QJS10_CPB15g00517 [Acorus calamus]
MTLLERFREVVSRLIVLSAITKEQAAQPQRCARAGAHDSHHSQAVEDCIEFLKRSAGVAAEAAAEEDVEGVGEVVAEAGDQVVLSAVQVM